MKSISKLAAEAGVPKGTVFSRLRRGASLSEALLPEKQALAPEKKPITVCGKKYASVSEAARANNLSVSTLQARIRAGCPEKGLLAPACTDKLPKGARKKGRYKGEDMYNRTMDYIEYVEGSDIDGETL